MTHTTKSSFDIIIIGGGPAGLQAALVLVRTQKKILILDDPAPPRNQASHGVHNYLGFEGLIPSKIREIAWRQIDVYKSAELHKEKVVDILKGNENGFLIKTNSGNEFHTRKLILAFGYHDIYPNIPGFLDCWGTTIIPCPFCDGYENRDRVWGIVKTSSKEPDIRMAVKIIKNWTSKIKFFNLLENDIRPEIKNDLKVMGVPFYSAQIVEFNHTGNKLTSVTLDSGEVVNVETLLFHPETKPSPLVKILIDNFGLELDDEGNIKTDETQATNIEGIWAAGDVKGWVGSLEAAVAGKIAAEWILIKWFQ